jgi:hypothetical protein
MRYNNVGMDGVLGEDSLLEVIVDHDSTTNAAIEKAEKIVCYYHSLLLSLGVCEEDACQIMSIVDLIAEIKADALSAILGSMKQQDVACAQISHEPKKLTPAAKEFLIQLERMDTQLLG